MKQGDYTDHNMSPMEIRQQIAPLYGPELEAFEWLQKSILEDNEDLDFDDMIHEGVDRGYFYLGDHGELRVNSEAHVGDF